jgi:LPXTG-site transpeptidase (sortase) family protein
MRALVALGGLLLALSGGLLAVNAWGEWQHRQLMTAASGVVQAPPAPRAAVPVAMPTLVPIAPPEPTSLPEAISPPAPEPISAPEPTPPPEPTPASTQAPTPAAVPTPAAPIAAQADAEEPGPAEEFVSYGPATWMEIPRIEVDSRIMEVGVKDGAYEAPSWEVGHHEDSVNPGEPGNSIFNGHLTTINAGKVFAHLRDLSIGDSILLYTHTHLLEWRVDETFDTDNDDNSFIQPTDDTRITLYTCDGQLIPFAHDYNKRLVVIGRLAAVHERDN